MIKQTQENIIALIVIILILVGVVIYYVWYTPDKNGVGDKIADVIDELQNKADRTARQSEHSTPVKKLEDTASDTIDDLEKSTNLQ